MELQRLGIWRNYDIAAKEMTEEKKKKMQLKQVLNTYIYIYIYIYKVRLHSIAFSHFAYDKKYTF